MDTEEAAAVNGGGREDAEQNLVLHLDANDVDSYDGDGDVWYDISEHDVTIPLSDNADDLELHLNASDSTSYGGSGTTWTDISGNSNDGTISGATFGADNGGYFDFDSNDYISVPSTSSTPVDFSAKNYTIEAWINPDTTALSNPILTKYGTTDSLRSIHFSYISSGKIRLFERATGTNASHESTSTLTLNRWTHVAVTRTSSQVKLYIDGSLDATISSTFTPNNGGSQNINIGSQANGQFNFFDGQIGEVRVYSKSLSASEVGQNYRHGRGYIYTDLIDDTDLELHLDPTSYSGSGTTWTADVGSDATINGADYDQELGDWFDFNGSSNDVRLNSGNTIPAATFDNCTFEYWIRLDDLSESRHLYLHDFTSNNANFIGISKSNTNNKLMVFGSAPHITISRGNTDLVTNKWTHIAVSLTSSQIKMYINGKLDAIVSQSFSGFSSPLYGTIGNDRRGSSTAGPKWLNGQVGQFRIYSTALTQDQVIQNYNFTKPSYPNGNNATNNGATFSPSTTPNYWSFDGSNDSMLLSTTNTLLGDTNNIKTISGFITLSSTTARGFIYSVSASNNINDYFYIGWLGDQNKVYVTSRDGSSSNSFTHTAPLTGVANTWKHICVTGGDGNTPKIYVNGVELTVTSSLSGSATSASWIDYPSYSGTIYTYVAKLRQYLPASTHWHNGRIGQVKLYDNTLTSTEVLALFNAEKDTYGL